MKYRKKPVVIEAKRLMEPNLPDEIARWCDGRVCGVGDVGAKVWIEIDTLEGVMRADYGDYIIKEPFPTDDRNFYPCKSDIFEKTYEMVPDFEHTTDQEVKEYQELLRQCTFQDGTPCGIKT